MNWTRTKHTLSTRPAPGEIVAYAHRHPSDKVAGVVGYAVVRMAGGVEHLWDGATVRSLPPRWRDQVEWIAADDVEDTPRRASPELGDWIQETVIRRAQELDLSSYGVAMATGGRVSEDAVRAYLTRRASMGSHKLQHVLLALGLQLAIAPGPD